MVSKRTTCALGIVIVLLVLAAAGSVLSVGRGTSTLRAGGSGTGPDPVPNESSGPSLPPPIDTTAAPATTNPQAASPTLPAAPSTTTKSASQRPQTTSTTGPKPAPAWRAPEDCRGLWEVDPSAGTARSLSAVSASQMSWSSDGRLLAYLRPSSARYESLVAVLDPSTGSERVLRQQSGANYGAPQWTPDGRTLVVVENFTASASAGAVLAIEMASGQARTIRKTSPSDPVANMSLSPDGRRIAFGRADTSIRVMNIDGTGERQVVAGIRRSGPMPWSPTGTEIAYTALGDEGGVFVIDMATDTVRRLTTGNAAGVSWAPTGDRLVAALADGIRVIEHLSGSTRLIAPGADAVWSPDAASIAYGRVAPAEGTAERPIQRKDILVVRADGGTPRLVVEDAGGRVTAPVVWSPNGERILVACR